MKRRDLLRHLTTHGCSLKKARSAIPRHNEINEHLARKICKDLGVPLP